MQFLVLEYLEGETLAARLQRGALPPAEALAIAIQIAGALDRAHRQGIVHRDLKPGNVMLTKGGAKLLDFGLAKAAPPGIVAVNPAMVTTTLTPPEKAITTQGTILGTVQYMAPEQVEGQEAGSRADLFAFGAVLFEMLTGRRAFGGKTQANLIGAILKDDPPPVSQLQPMAPPALDRVVKTCLAKDPDDRFQTAHDLLLQLRWIQEGGSAAGVPAPVVAHRRHRERFAWIALAVVSAVLLATLVPVVRTLRSPAAAVPAPQVRFTVPTRDPSADGALQIAVSPNGRLLAYLGGSASGGSEVWLRPLDEPSGHAVAGTDGASVFFWSADSRRVAFSQGGTLKAVDVISGGTQAITDLRVNNLVGGTWNRDGDILFAMGGAGNVSLLRVSDRGGTAAPVLQPDPSQGATSLMWPVFLPDGRRFLYRASHSDPARAGIYAASLDGGEPVLVVACESAPIFAAPDTLLYLRAGNLVAQTFDLAQLRVVGEPARVVDGVAYNRVTGRTAASASDTGVLVFRGGSATDQVSDLAWLDRAGKPLGTAGEPGMYNQVRLSPDEKRVVVSLPDPHSTFYNMWTLDLGNRISSQATFNESANDPVWSPDGQSIAFESTRNGTRDFYRQRVGTRAPVLMFASPDDPKWIDDWSRDGKYLLFHLPPPSTLYAVALDGDAQKTSKPLLIATSPANLDGVHFSPDGRWVVYQTNETGEYEVWVAAFPSFDHRRRISSHTGGQAFWRGDGREIFYLTVDGVMMSVNVTPEPAGGDLGFATPAKLFASPLPRPMLAIDQYAVPRDGQRFLFIRPRGDQAGTLAPVTVVVNWRSPKG